MNKNSLIELLPKPIQDLIFSKDGVIELSLSKIVCVVDEPTEYLYFPIDGFI